MKKPQPTLAELRARAYAAFEAHEQDMKNDATYRREAKAAERRQVRAQRRTYGEEK